MPRCRREDTNSASIMEATRDDAKMGRMSWPRPLVQDGEQHSRLLSPRFGVEQGVREDGSKKVRPIDDYSASGVNACCQPCERTRHDGVDALYALTRQLHEQSGEAPGLFKADIDSAFRRAASFALACRRLLRSCICRRIPVAPEDRWASAVAFMHQGTWYTSEHHALPFGSVASVYAWERIGSLLAHLGRKLLHIPLLRCASLAVRIMRRPLFCIASAVT